jgi:hypothetical protein
MCFAAHIYFIEVSETQCTLDEDLGQLEYHSKLDLYLSDMMLSDG